MRAPRVGTTCLYGADFWTVVAGPLTITAMPAVPGENVPRGITPEQAAPVKPSPDVAETPDQAREIDYGVRASIAGIWLMTAYSVPVFVFAILLSHATLILLVAPAGLLIAAIGLHIYLRRSQRRRLANFINPINGELEIPGGRRELKLRNLIRRKHS
jgi:hypothetical protein